MAAQLKLVKREDLGADVNSIDLLDGGNGFTLAKDGWVINTPEKLSSLFAIVPEAMTLRATGTSQDNLATVLQALTAKKQQGEWYQSEIERYGVWLRAQLDNETNARQTFIKTIKHRASGDYFSHATRYHNKMVEYTLGLERVGLWEATSYLNYAYTTNFVPIGAKIDYTTYGGSPGAVTGDVAGRPAFVELYTPVGASHFFEAWVGFRTEHYGDRSLFQSAWSLRKGAATDADTTTGTTNADATALDGYKTVTTFATISSLTQRVNIRIRDVTLDYEEQRGEYQVLLRAKLSASGTVRVRLADGMYLSAPSTYHARARVVVDKTNWYIYDLGTLKIPNSGRTVSQGDFVLYGMGLGIDAERVSGSCSLEMDCLVLQPIAEGSLYIKGSYYVSAAYARLVIEQRPDGAVYGINRVGTVSGSIDWAKASVKGGVPIGNGIAVITAQRDTQSVLTDEMDTFTMYVYPRWETLRGAG